ncbi:protein ALP1-like [Acropora millepora]|uniref:protein ALP1-like n=1 Tax=Acropora millepora TaxID=45264 RepID=UPI001CF2BA96|nr:protein ALP1-like [Acropora millepora]
MALADKLCRRCKRMTFTWSGDELVQVIAHYKERWGFPVCAGAINGTHIAIATPPHNHVAYVNRKSYHSIVMQAVVDGHYMFRDIVVGWPGSVHDARVFSNSQFYNLGCSGHLFPEDVQDTILGRQVHPVILGDPAYPMLNWLMKAYPENTNTS